MKGSKQVVDVLNEALAAEILASTQYLVHARMNSNRGYLALASILQAEATEESGHARLLIDRILFLEGTPEPRMKESPEIGQTVREQIQSDLALQHRAVKRLNAGIAIARQQGDETSAVLLTTILSAEEEHVLWLETQLSLIDKLGEVTYLQSQLGPPPAIAPAPAPAGG